MDTGEWVVLGRILGPHGVKGWVRIYSDTRPAERIFDQPQWWLGVQHQPYRLVEKGRSGKAMIALLTAEAGAVLADRDQALNLRGLEIAVPRSALPEPDDGSNYWSDMIGLRVESLQGESLGRVEKFLESAAHDVLLASEGERRWLIPFVRGEIVEQVDLEKGVIRVDWSPDWD